MTLSTNLERLNGGTTDGCVATGLHREVITVTAARTLKKEESGALIVFDIASGATVTLPEAEEGIQFEFLVKTTITSNSAKVITGAADDFLVGAIDFGGDANTTLSTAISAFAADGSTHVAIAGNGTTTGMKAGSSFRVVAITGALWGINGTIIGSGSVATPFATS
jgi:DNA gyrase/topoisomerase IV subunit B